MARIFVLDKLPNCNHAGKLEYMSWPDGSGVEICNCCGFSRNVWEQGESDWMMVDVDEAYEQVKKAFERLR